MGYVVNLSSHYRAFIDAAYKKSFRVTSPSARGGGFASAKARPYSETELLVKQLQDIVERIRNAMSHSNQDKRSLPRRISQWLETRTQLELLDIVTTANEMVEVDASIEKTASSCRKRPRVINGFP